MTQITFILSQLKVELQKMVEVENQVVGLYENMDAKKARVVKKEKEYGDHLTKMGVELETKLASELRLTNDNKALKIWGEKVCQ